MIEFGTLSRGNGKIYIALDADVPEGAALEASSEAAGGLACPAVVVKALDGKDVLVLAVLKKDQAATVRVRNADGSVGESASLRVGSTSSAIRSKINTLQKKEGLGAIRNADASPLVDEAWVTVGEIIDFDIDSDVVRGGAEFCSFEPFDADSEVRVQLLDANGNECATDVMILADETYEQGGGYLRTVRYSARISKRLASFFVWAECPGSATAPGFVAAQPWTVTDLRKGWIGMLESTPAGPGFGDWYGWTQIPTERALTLQKQHGFFEGIGFSVVVPIEVGTTAAAGIATVDSLAAQTYTDFEVLLCVAPGCADASAISSRAATAMPGKVHVVAPAETGWRDAVLGASSQPYVCFVEAGATLSQQCLFEYASAINKAGALDLLFCDEDRIENSRHVDGRLKSAYDRLQLPEQNCIGNMLCLSRARLEALDLAAVPMPDTYALALLADVEDSKACNISKVLYHGPSAKAKPAANADALVHAFLAEKGVSAMVEPCPGVPGARKISYDANLSASVVVVDPNGDGSHADNIEAIVDSLADSADIVVAGPADYASYGVSKTIPVPAGAGYAQACNLAAHGLEGDILVFVDASTKPVSKGWLVELVSVFARFEVAAAGVKQLYRDGTIRHVGVCLPFNNPRFANHGLSREATGYLRTCRARRQVSAVEGACIAVRRSEFEAAEGFDEAFSQAAAQVDLCLRLREKDGWVAMCPAVVFEAPFGTGANEVLPDFRGTARRDKVLGIAQCREEGLFRQRWKQYYGYGDPFYSTELKAGFCHYEI